MINNCSTGNSVTISRSTVEFGNSSGTGGGMTFLTGASEACSSTVVSLKPTMLSILSTQLFNTTLLITKVVDLSSPSTHQITFAAVLRWTLKM